MKKVQEFYDSKFTKNDIVLHPMHGGGWGSKGPKYADIILEQSQTNQPTNQLIN